MHSTLFNDGRKFQVIRKNLENLGNVDLILDHDSKNNQNFKNSFSLSKISSQIHNNLSFEEAIICKD